jgi:hypothetical protein
MMFGKLKNIILSRIVFAQIILLSGKLNGKSFKINLGIALWRFIALSMFYRLGNNFYYSSKSSLRLGIIVFFHPSEIFS